MALKLTKSTTLDGMSVINDVPVMTMMATISEENAGTSYVNQSVVNQELYNANKVQVRKDLSEFQTAVFEVEDALQSEKDSRKEKE